MDERLSGDGWRKENVISIKTLLEKKTFANKTLLTKCNFDKTLSKFSLNNCIILVDSGKRTTNWSLVMEFVGRKQTEE